MHSLGASIVADLKPAGRIKLPGFHAEFVRAAFAPGVELAALSVPRGSAKTWLAGNLAALAVTPDSPLFEPGREVLGVSASLEQSRVMLQFAREALADREDDYRWLDSGQRLAVTHKASKARLRILSSSGRSARWARRISERSSPMSREAGRIARRRAVSGMRSARQLGQARRVSASC